MLPTGRIVIAFHTRPGLIVAPFFTDDPLGLSGWRRGNMQNLPYEDSVEPGARAQPVPARLLRGDGVSRPGVDASGSWLLKAATPEKTGRLPC